MEWKPDQDPAETDCLNNSDSFSYLIQREVFKNLRRIQEEKKHYFILKKYIPTFSEEIRCMMHTHGDVEGPLPESVLLVGTILRDQMNILLIKATEVKTDNTKGRLTHENILPILRENKAQLKRLLCYLKLKDMKDCFYKRRPLMEDEEEKPADNISASTSHILTKLVDRPEYGRRVRTCLEFLRKTDKSFDCEAIMDNSVEDPVTMNRQKRRYLMTLNMTSAEYMEYARKLQASFLPKGGGKLFLKWLLVDNVTHLVPDEFALEMINYLAYETVAEVIDLSLRLMYNRNPENVNESTYSSNNEETLVQNNDSISCDSIVRTENANNTLQGTTTSKSTLNVVQETVELIPNLSAKENSDSLRSIQDMEIHKSIQNEECMMSLDESIVPNVFNKSDFHINTYDIKSLSKDFGDEFKDGVKKEPITPDIIKEALNLYCGNNKHKYDTQWKSTKSYDLLCIQDNYTIPLHRD